MSKIDLKKVPHQPGVYLYKDDQDRVLYVGKAIDLHSRVTSYFQGGLPAKTAQLVSLVEKVETISVESELEALVLEANLIKQHLPAYNVRLVDDKGYLYIRVTKEPYPKIVTARKHELAGSRDYFGPFPSSRTVKETLKRLRRVFPWCSAPPSEVNLKFKIKNLKLRSCFYYHLGLCPGACVGRVSQDQYRRNIARFRQFMDGQHSQLLNELTIEMNQLAAEQLFEAAGAVKKTIEGVQYLLQPNRAELYLENPNFLENERQQALLDLQTQLDLADLPQRIECFDISNIQGSLAVGSMVVATAGEIDKSQYRKFKIKSTVKTGQPEDLKMMAEIVRRRLKNDWVLPQLILIDGGVGQVRAAELMLKQQSLSIPVFGLAKRFEWLYTPGGEVIKLSKKSLALKLLQQIRDEAHRFALSYHRKLRSKAVYN